MGVTSFAPCGLYLPIHGTPDIGRVWGNTQKTLIDSLSPIDRAAHVFVAPKTATITHGWVYDTAKSGTPGNLRVSFQGVNSSGQPDGTILGGASPWSGNLAGTETAGGFWVALDNSASIVGGNEYAYVLEPIDGTWDGSNNRQILIGWGTTANWDGPPTTLQELAGGGWANQVIRAPIFGYRNATETFFNPWSQPDTNETTGTAGHRIAQKFTIPTSFCSSLKCIGFRIHSETVATEAVNAIKYGLWDSSSQLQGKTLANVQMAWPDNGPATHDFPFGAEQTLTAGTTYYVGLEQVSTTTLRVQKHRVIDTDAQKAFWGLNGNSWGTVSTYNGSVWTDDTESIIFVSLIVTEITTPSGGGMLVHPGMSGGMRG